MQIHHKKIQHHKRHFQLLELMVAAFILLICLAPMMKIFTSMYQSQREIIRENQRDHLAHLVHAKFVEQLYKREISLQDVMQSKSIELRDRELITLLEKSAYQCVGTFTVLESYTPKGQEKPIKYLGQLVVKMKDNAHKPERQIGGKKIENQDPSETFYDYYVYIDSGAMDKKGLDNKKDAKETQDQGESENEKVTPQTPSADQTEGQEEEAEE